jgi:hypothetical protein
MLTLFLAWLLGTALMPLALGGALGALAPRLLHTGRAARVAAWCALAALLVHLLLVGSGVVRDGAMLDYGAVLATAWGVAAWRCR